MKKITSCGIQSQLHRPMGEFKSHLTFPLTHTRDRMGTGQMVQTNRPLSHYAATNTLFWTAMSYQRGNTLRRTVSTQSADVECFQCSFVHGAQKMLTVQQMLKKYREFYSDITLINTSDSAQFPCPAVRVVSSPHLLNMSTLQIYVLCLIMGYYGYGSD